MRLSTIALILSTLLIINVSCANLRKLEEEEENKISNLSEKP